LIIKESAYDRMCLLSSSKRVDGDAEEEKAERGNASVARVIPHHPVMLPSWNKLLDFQSTLHSCYRGWILELISELKDPS